MGKPWGKIAMSYRCGVAADPHFGRCWTKLLMCGRREGDIVMGPVVEMPQHYAAEAMVQNFLKTKADTLLAIDDDMIFEPKDLDTLRFDKEGEDYDCLMGLCLSRSAPHRPVILEPYGDKYKVCSVPPKDTIVPVSIVGLAFTLIRREVFEGIEKDDNEMFFQWSKRGDSEDSGFSCLARAAGFKLGVSTRVCIGHRIKVTVKWDWRDNGINYEEYERGLGKSI